MEIDISRTSVAVQRSTWKTYIRGNTVRLFEIVSVRNKVKKM